MDRAQDMFEIVHLLLIGLRNGGHQEGDLISEPVPDVPDRILSVLHHVMEKCGTDDGGILLAHLRHYDARYCNRVQEVRLSALARLVFMRLLRKVICRFNEGTAFLMNGTRQGCLQILPGLGNLFFVRHS